MSAPIYSRRSMMIMGGSALMCSGSSGWASELTPSSHSSSIATALYKLRNAPVPPMVAERVGWTLLDAFAVMHGGAKVAGTANFIGIMADRRGTPSASVPALSLHLAAESAAALNAFLLHASEIDDSDLRGQLRASAVVLPAIMATAEIADSSGADFIRALALGYTLQGRFVAPLRFPIQSRGWMASGVWGPPAAAGAAGLLMKLTPSQIASAIGLAGSGAGGLFQYFFDQTEEKRLIVARAARTSVESVRLASAGETGPIRIIEGQAGLYKLFSGEAAPNISVLTDDLGAMEGPLFIYPKLFAASHSIIPSLDGMAMDLPASFNWEDVDNYIVRGDQGWADTVGTKISNYAAPSSALGAMLNYGFVIAMYLIHGSVLPDDYAAALHDPRIDAFARRGVFEVQPGPADLSIEFRMKSGASFRVRARTPGLQDPAPLDVERRMRKVTQLTKDLSRENREALNELCHSVSTAKSMRDWVRKVAAVLHS